MKFFSRKKPDLELRVVLLSTYVPVGGCPSLLASLFSSAASFRSLVAILHTQLHLHSSHALHLQCISTHECSGLYGGTTDGVQTYFFIFSSCDRACFFNN